MDLTPKKVKSNIFMATAASYSDTLTNACMSKGIVRRILEVLPGRKRIAQGRSPPLSRP